MLMGEVLVRLSVTLDINGGWSLHPQVTACGWSSSSLPPCNSTTAVPCKASRMHQPADHVGVYRSGGEALCLC